MDGNRVAPPVRADLTTTFHTEVPSQASITALWRDAAGSHSETFNYTIMRPNH